MSHGFLPAIRSSFRGELDDKNDNILHVAIILHLSANGVTSRINH